MNYNTQKQWFQQQLKATQELLDASSDSVLMQLSLKNRIAELEANINSVEDNASPATKVSLWFSGDAPDDDFFACGQLGRDAGKRNRQIVEINGILIAYAKTVEQVQKC